MKFVPSSKIKDVLKEMPLGLVVVDFTTDAFLNPVLGRSWADKPCGFGSCEMLLQQGRKDGVGSFAYFDSLGLNKDHQFLLTHPLTMDNLQMFFVNAIMYRDYTVVDELLSSMFTWLKKNYKHVIVVHDDVFLGAFGGRLKEQRTRLAERRLGSNY